MQPRDAPRGDPAGQPDVAVPPRPLPTHDELLEKVGHFPRGPGVYVFHDERRRAIYIGKAADLRARVRSYLREGADDGRAFFPFLARNIRDVDCIATTNAKEALLLENTLIKREKPRYNVRLVDDKTYLSIEVTTDEPFPRARLVRRVRKGARAFGPYASASAVRETLRHVRRYFPLRTCSNAELRQRTRPCIEHAMGRCGAPCVGLQGEADYGRVVDDVVLFLEGRDDALLPRLRARMLEASAALEFERAARVRDQIAAIDATLERQRVARATGDREQDAFGVAARDGAVVVYLLGVREGKVVAARAHPLRSTLAPPEALNAFLGQLYVASTRVPPAEVLLPFDVPDRETLEEVLGERRGTRVEVKVAVRGERAELLALAAKNAELALDTTDEHRRVIEAALEALRERLGLARPPRSIECFDISTIQGAFNVASQVRFDDGVPAKSRYRRYRVRDVVGQDDFAAMREVLGRRARRGLRDGDLPELIVIDGGKGQLSSALAAFAAGGVPPERVELVGLAKARAGGVGPRAFERIFRAGVAEPIVLDPRDPACGLLARVRDEAHRFAVAYHRELRRRLAFSGGLDEIPGVGPKRRRALLERFGNLRGIRAATVEELATVVPLEVAERVRACLAEEGGDTKVRDGGGGRMTP